MGTDDLDILAAEARTFADRGTKTFFELGAALALLREHHPKAFHQVIGDAGISRRHAYYVLEVRERYAPFTEHETSLRAIGWTKLTVLAPAITPTDAETLLWPADAAGANGSARSSGAPLQRTAHAASRFS